MTFECRQKYYQEWYKNNKDSAGRKANRAEGNMMQRQKRLEKIGLPYYLSDVTPNKIIDIARRRAE